MISYEYSKPVFRNEGVWGSNPLAAPLILGFFNKFSDLQLLSANRPTFGPTPYMNNDYEGAWWR